MKDAVDPPTLDSVNESRGGVDFDEITTLDPLGGRSMIPKLYGHDSSIVLNVNVGVLGVMLHFDDFSNQNHLQKKNKGEILKKTKLGDN